jgi:hypothetical protein
MDKTQHKLAMEFFRSEIKTLAKRISQNKTALRHNQRVASKGLDDPYKEYDKTGERYWWCAEQAIKNDKSVITALYILYAEIRGKKHLSEEKRQNYVSLIEVARKRMEEYIAQKQATLISNGSTGPGSI